MTPTFGQIDRSVKGGIKIEAIDTTDIPNKSIAVKATPILGASDKKATPIAVDKTNTTSKKRAGVNFSDNSKLPLPQWHINKTYGENNRNIAKYRKDFFLGSLKTKSRYFRIQCRDHEYVDGDRIKLLLNGEVLISKITLTSSYYTIDVKLKDGHNTIEFEALNEGSSSPNTAQLEVYNESNTLVAANQWLITTGYKAQLRVFKE